VVPFLTLNPTYSTLTLTLNPCPMDGSVFNLSTPLMSLFAIAFFKLIGLIRADESYRTHLPPVLTATSGTAKLCVRLFGLKSHGAVVAFILGLADEMDTTASRVENMICKIYKAKYKKATNFLGGSSTADFKF